MLDYPVLQPAMLRISCLLVIFATLYPVRRDTHVVYVGEHGVLSLGCVRWLFRDTRSGMPLVVSSYVASNVSHRYYGVIAACIMNLIGMIGFSILNCILGGQTLASVSNQHLSWT
jgi:hypothetical protein